MRRRKIKSVRTEARIKRSVWDVTYYDLDVFDSTIADLYAFIVLGYGPKKMNSVRGELIKKNRHPGRKDKYKKKWAKR